MTYGHGDSQFGGGQITHPLRGPRTAVQIATHTSGIRVVAASWNNEGGPFFRSLTMTCPAECCESRAKNGWPFGPKQSGALLVMSDPPGMAGLGPKKNTEAAPGMACTTPQDAVISSNLARC